MEGGSQGEPLWEESRGGHELEQPERLHRRRANTVTVKEGLKTSWPGFISHMCLFWHLSLVSRRPSPQLRHPCRQHVSSCHEKTLKYGDNRISSATRTAFTAQGRLSCIQLTSSRFSGAVWVTWTMWSHFSLWSFYLSDQGIICCFSQEE